MTEPAKMAKMDCSDQSKRFHDHIVTDKDVVYLPPYLRNVPETPEPVRCPTSGNWPEWLHGDFMRLGVGQIVIPTSEDGSRPNAVMQHWFDGLGMLHKFYMNGSEIYYSSRYTSAGLAKKAKKEGFVNTVFFGNNANEPLRSTQDPCSAAFGASQSVFKPSQPPAPPKPDEVIVNVVPRRGMHLPPSGNPHSQDVAANPEKDEVLNHTDWNLLQVCDAKTLEPKRILTYAEIDPELAGYGICAHPPKDRSRGLTFNYIISEKGEMSVFALDVRSKPTKLVWKTVLPCKACYIHSLAMTEKYAIFIRNPIHLDVKDMNAPIADSMICEPDEPTMFFVLDKMSGKVVASYSTPHSFIFFHAINAYDYVDPNKDTTTIHVDLCSYEGTYLPYGEFNFANLLDPAAPFSNGHLVRYELADLQSYSVTKPGRVTIAKSITGVVGDVPRIAKSASMKPGYRYIYLATDFGGPCPGTEFPLGKLGDGIKVPQAALFAGLAKTDWHTGKVSRWQLPDGESCPCEPIFIQRPGAAEEDDGVVLTIVINREGTHSVLVALDGKTFQELARAPMPQVYAIAPHGTFVED